MRGLLAKDPICTTRCLGLGLGLMIGVVAIIAVLTLAPRLHRFRDGTQRADGHPTGMSRA